MVDFISKKSGPRREDVVAKRLINDNWSTISRLADQISDGGFTKSRRAISKAKEKPEPASSNIYTVGSTCKAAIPDPIVQVTMNNRVIIMDARSGKQLSFLGEFRFEENQKYFSLAIKDNGFVGSVDEETKQKLMVLNGVIIESDDIEQAFIDAIKNLLEL